MRFFKKRAVVLTILLFLLLGGALAFRSVQKTVEPTVTPALPTAIPISLYPLPLVSPAAENQSTVFVLGFTPKDEAKEVAVYRALPTDPYGIAERLADKVLSNPTMSQDSGVRFWKTTSAQVTGQAIPPRVSYQAYDLPTQTGQGLTEARAEEIARNTARDLGVIGAEYSFTNPIVSRFDGTRTHPEGEVQSGGITKIGLTYMLAGLPVVDSTGGSLLFSVTVDMAGKMLGLSTAVPPTVVLANTVSVIPISQAVVALTNNKGVLTSAQYDRVDVGASLVRPRIKNATITSVALKYLWNDRAQVVVPVYVFDGYSDDDIQNGRIQLLYFVSATP